MSIDKEINKNRFTGFADVYDDVRPALPAYPVEMICRYLGKEPDRVVDLGCGTGLSTAAWRGKCREIVGVEPNADMLGIAKTRAVGGLSFVRGFAHDTGLASGSFDAAVCSQSFHWMEPVATLAEVSRLLKSGGVFAAVDCDWPPVVHPRVEKCYDELFLKVEELTGRYETLKNSFHKWPKERHLENIRKSGLFAYAREVVFANREECTAARLIGLAVSQGSLQALLKAYPQEIAAELNAFRQIVEDTFGTRTFSVDFCYRMRIGVKG